MKKMIGAVAVVAAAFASACADLTGADRMPVSAAMTAAYSTVTLGFNSTQSSFDSTAAGGVEPWFPGGFGPGGPRGPGRGGPPGADLGGLDGPMMGAGLGPDMLGGEGLGRGFGHGPMGDPRVHGDCHRGPGADSARTTCAPEERPNLTVVRSVAYFDAAGKAQTAFDSATTNTINTRTTVSGSFTRRDSSTTTVSNSSDRTVGGLAKGSTQHTIDGVAAGHEVSTGNAPDKGAFTAVRDLADTTRGLVIPVSTTGRSYPTAGTVIRTMKVVVTFAGEAAQTSTRREVVTYDGSANAKVVLTQDGTTKTCTLPLPFGRPVCE